MRGKIGISLSEGRTQCFPWIYRELNLRQGRILPCRISCAPTFNLAIQILVSRGRLGAVNSYLKRTQFFFSICLFSAYWRYWPSHVECCYHPIYQYLLESPTPGSGRSHAYHRERQFARYEEEENAYTDCCFGPYSSILCPFFYYLRPVCTSQFWNFDRPRWCE